MTVREQAALRAVCETLVPGAGARLAEQVAARIGQLPRVADRTELRRLLRLIETPLVNLLLAATPRPFTALPPDRRERYLRAWAASRLPLFRKAFQALKRLATVTHYTATNGVEANDTWRDIGYPGPPLRPAQPPTTTPERLNTLPVARDTTIDCDVVVVGSGAGGGVMAAVLAAAGRDVVVLERGGHSEAGDFTQRETDGMARLYDAAGLRTTRDLGVLLLQGSCVGGGTVVNYTTSFHPPAAVRAEWARNHNVPELEGDDFTRSLDAVAARLGVNTAHNAPSERDRVLLRGLERLGWHHGLLPRNVRACPQDDACGFCAYGCPRDAKQSTLVTYLRDAAARGARIVPQAEARRITIERGRATGVEALVQGRVALRVRARAVVVAGGAIHSPALLLRSGIDLPALGRHLALHPATAVFGLMDEDVRPWSGALQTRYSDQFADIHEGYGFKLETVPMHPSLYAVALPWTSGTQHRDGMRRLPRTAFVGILLRDRHGGRVTIDRDGEPVVDYGLSRYDLAHVRRGLAAAAEVLEAAGAREIWLPAGEWLAYRPGAAGARAEWLAAADARGYGPNRLLLASFHQMATCRMGGDRRTSVVDAEHQVWGVPGLHVADAAVFPGASGVNPMLTIMGLAHRAATTLAARL